jgi:hypothetical protein
MVASSVAGVEADDAFGTDDIGAVVVTGAVGNVELGVALVVGVEFVGDGAVTGALVAWVAPPHAEASKAIAPRATSASRRAVPVVVVIVVRPSRTTQWS